MDNKNIYKGEKYLKRKIVDRDFVFKMLLYCILITTIARVWMDLRSVRIGLFRHACRVCFVIIIENIWCFGDLDKKTANILFAVFLIGILSRVPEIQNDFQIMVSLTPCNSLVGLADIVRTARYCLEFWKHQSNSGDFSPIKAPRSKNAPPKNRFRLASS